VTGRPLVDAHHHVWDSTRHPYPWLTVDRLCIDDDTIVAMFDEAIADRPRTEQDALRHDDAMRIYNMSRR